MEIIGEEVTISQILEVGVLKGELKLEQLKSFFYLYPFPAREESVLYIHSHAVLEMLVTPTFGSVEMYKWGLLSNIGKFWTRLCCFVHKKVNGHLRAVRVQKFRLTLWVFFNINHQYTQHTDTGP